MRKMTKWKNDKRTGQKRRFFQFFLKKGCNLKKL